MFLIKGKIFPIAVLVLGLSLGAAAQSTDQNFPTAVTTNEINGSIRARDMGDSRATTYYYAFDGGQGDIFVNVVAKNFNGDIDIFTADALTPLTKMVVYADAGEAENGRLIYLRKAERLILRVEGRTPNDEPASFRIKFGGSFIALAPQRQEEAPTVARNDPSEPGVKVDSVGRIVAIIPKPQPTPKIVEPPPVKETVIAKSERPAVTGGRPVSKTTTTRTTTPPDAKRPLKKKSAEIGTVYENEAAKVTVAPEPKAEPAASAGGKTSKPKSPPTSKKTKPSRTKPADTTVAVPPGVENVPPPLAAALASIRLVIQMKDGTVFWMPMNKVAKFAVDKGVMTVTTTDGSVTRYNILDVEKTTIQ